MKINIKFFVLLCLITLCVVYPDIAGAAPKKRKSAPTSQEFGKIITVSAEGAAPIAEGRKAEAREAARRELIRNALDIAVGSFVESVTKIENYKAVSDKVFSQSKGIVRGLSIKEEWVDAGSHGDNIELGDNSLILINGVPFPNSAPLSHDRAGRFLQPFPLPVVLASDEIWLLSQSPFGFDSRYLGAANIFKCYKAIPLLTF